MTSPIQPGAPTRGASNDIVNQNLEFFIEQQRLNNKRVGIIDRIGQYVWWGRLRSNYTKAIVCSVGTMLLIGGPTLLGGPFLALTIGGMVVFGAMTLCVNHYLETGGDLKPKPNSKGIFSGKKVEQTPEEVERRRRDPNIKSPYRDYSNPNITEGQSYRMRDWPPPTP